MGGMHNGLGTTEPVSLESVLVGEMWLETSLYVKDCSPISAEGAEGKAR